MKSGILHRIASALVLSVFTVQAVGFTIDLHYCEGELQDFAFLGSAEECNSEKSDQLHPCCQNRILKHLKESLPLIKKKDCCSNEIIHVEMDNEAEESAFQTFGQDLAIEGFSITEFKGEHRYSSLNCPVIKPNPPPVSSFDILVRIQKFTI